MEGRATLERALSRSEGLTVFSCVWGIDEAAEEEEEEEDGTAEAEAAEEEEGEEGGSRERRTSPSVTGFPPAGERSFTDTEALELCVEPTVEPTVEPMAELCVEGCVGREGEPRLLVGLTNDDEDADDAEATEATEATAGLVREGDEGDGDEGDADSLAEAAETRRPFPPTPDETLDETLDEATLGVTAPFPRFPCPETPVPRRARLVDRFPSVPAVPEAPEVPAVPLVPLVPAVPLVPLAAARDRILRQSRVLDFSSCALQGNPRGCRLHGESLLRRRLYASFPPSVPTLRFASRQHRRSARHYASSPRFYPTSVPAHHGSSLQHAAPAPAQSPRFRRAKRRRAHAPTRNRALAHLALQLRQPVRQFPQFPLQLRPPRRRQICSRTAGKREIRCARKSRRKLFISAGVSRCDSVDAAWLCRDDSPREFEGSWRECGFSTAPRIHWSHVTAGSGVGIFP